MRPYSVWLALVWMLLGGATSGSAQPQPPTASAIDLAFVGEARFDRKLDLSAGDEALEDLLPRIGKEIGLSLKTTRDTRDLKVTLAFRGVSVGRILTTVARLLDLDWDKQAGAYVLIQSIRAKQREAAARDADASAAWDYTVDLLKAAAVMARPSPEPLQEQMHESFARLRDPDATQAERLAALTEMGRLTTLNDPTTYRVARLFQRIVPRQKAALRHGARVILRSTDPGIGQAILREVRDELLWRDASRQRQVGEGSSALPDAGDTNSFEFLYQAEFIFAKQRIAAGPTAFACGRQSPPSMSAILSRVTRSEGRIIGRASWIWSSGRYEGGGRLSAPTTTRDTGPLAQPVSFPKAPARTRDAPAMDRPSTSLPDVLEKLRPQLAQQLIAPGFARLRVENQELAMVKTLGEFLRLLNHTLNVGWSIQNDVLRINSASWAVDRSEETPNRILRPLRLQTNLDPTALITLYAATAAACTDDQLLGLQQYWRSYFDGLPINMPNAGSGVYDRRQDLRLLHQIGPGLRGRLLSGVEISESQLHPSARQRLFGLATQSEDPRQTGMHNGVMRVPPSLTLRAELVPTTYWSCRGASGKASDGYLFGPRQHSAPISLAPGDIATRVPALMVALFYGSSDSLTPPLPHSLYIPREETRHPTGRTAQ